MAIRTLAEGDSGVSRLSTRRRWCMAFRARHLRMEAGERVPGLRVVELRCRFPVHEVVTLQTILSQLAVVNIFVATDAVLRQAQKGAAQILHLDQRTCSRLNARGHVALAAVNPRVLSLQRVARLRVIEGFE